MEKPPPLPPNDKPPPIPDNPVRPRTSFTGAGLALAVVTVLVTIGAALLFPFWVYPRFLPPGAYPRLLLALPIILCGVVVAGVGAWLLEKLGIAITTPDDDSGAS